MSCAGLLVPSAAGTALDRARGARPKALLDDPVPDLGWYDYVVVNLSGGKDSMELLRLVSGAATAAGVGDRLVAVHADLGPMEWQGVGALVAQHAELYGVPLRVVRADPRKGTLFDRILRRGRWPGHSTRFCTASMKRDPVQTVFTALAAELRAAGVVDRPVRILSAMGMRAQESPMRRKMPAFRHQGSMTCVCEPCRQLRALGVKPGSGPSNTRKHVDEWLPIHHLTTAEVWAGIAASGVPYHPAYDWGMPRLSCVICPLASKAALVRAAQLRPDLALAARSIERRIGHRIHADESMARIWAVARDGSAAAGVSAVDDWEA